jgi:PIN domain nuclease of toxin-antitoxin system
MSIKTKKGLLEVDGDLVGSIQASHLSILPITESHAWTVELLPEHHVDPLLSDARRPGAHREHGHRHG